MRISVTEIALAVAIVLLMLGADPKSRYTFFGVLAFLVGIVSLFMPETRFYMAAR